jgi:hypothetical protein
MYRSCMGMSRHFLSVICITCGYYFLAVSRNWSLFQATDSFNGVFQLVHLSFEFITLLRNLFLTFSKKNGFPAHVFYFLIIFSKHTCSAVVESTTFFAHNVDHIMNNICLSHQVMKGHSLIT